MAIVSCRMQTDVERRFREAKLAGSAALVRWLKVEIIPADAWPALERLLDPAEISRALRFRTQEDRRAYVAAHGLARIVAGLWLGRRPGDIVLGRAPSGRPLVRDAACGLSLSHAPGLVAAAVAAFDVGVDVERLTPGAFGPDVMEIAFTPEEREAIGQGASDAALMAWTLKEAYGKATGLGLAAPPAPVGSRAWSFRRLRPAPGYGLGLAMRRPHVAAAALDMRAMRLEELLQELDRPGEVGKARERPAAVQ